MTHQELIDSAAAYALGSLDGEELEAFEEHLPDCDVCRAEVASFRETVGLLALPLPPVRPVSEDALRVRVLERAQQARPAPKARGWRAPGWRAHGWRPRATHLAWTAAAACLALAAVGGLAYRAERGARAIVAADLAAARAELAVRDSTLAALLGPEVHVVSLRAPQRAPSVRVFWNHTRDLFIVTAFDLPPAPPGRTYQLWAMPRGKRPVSMGTFEVDARGRAARVIPVTPAVEAGGFIDECGLTVEPAGGSPQPTERPRLLGTWRHAD
jgi:anti-sigma-K factor RskA